MSMAVWRCRVREVVEGVVYLAGMVSLPVGGDGGDAFMKRRIRLLKLQRYLSPDALGAEATLGILFQETKAFLLCCHTSPREQPPSFLLSFVTMPRTLP